ncbi:hypothetical protein MMC25_001575 [Agyrium rufum]|nr:hypothetical protein [Agyrium rufum]
MSCFDNNSNYCPKDSFQRDSNSGDEPEVATMTKKDWNNGSLRKLWHTNRSECLTKASKSYLKSGSWNMFLYWSNLASLDEKFRETEDLKKIVDHELL